MTTVTQSVTADDLWKMPENGRGFELFHGELRPMSPTNYNHSRISISIGSILREYSRVNDSGDVLTELGCVVWPEEHTVLAPDIAFIAKARRPQNENIDRYFNGAPDLAVEVLSPSDSWQSLEEKAVEYLDAGTRLVWIVNPNHRSVTVYQPGPVITYLKSTDSISGQDVLPGFVCDLAEFFA